MFAFCPAGAFGTRPRATIELCAAPADIPARFGTVTSVVAAVVGGVVVDTVVAGGGTVELVDVVDGGVAATVGPPDCDRQFRIPLAGWAAVAVVAATGVFTVLTVVAWHTVPVESHVPADPSDWVHGVPGVPVAAAPDFFFFFSSRNAPASAVTASSHTYSADGPTRSFSDPRRLLSPSIRSPLPRGERRSSPTSPARSAGHGTYRARADRSTADEAPTRRSRCPQAGRDAHVPPGTPEATSRRPRPPGPHWGPLPSPAPTRPPRPRPPPGRRARSSPGPPSASAGNGPG